MSGLVDGRLIKQSFRKISFQIWAFGSMNWNDKIYVDQCPRHQIRSTCIIRYVYIYMIYMIYYPTPYLSVLRPSPSLKDARAAWTEDSWIWKMGLMLFLCMEKKMTTLYPECICRAASRQWVSMPAVLKAACSRSKTTFCVVTAVQILHVPSWTVPQRQQGWRDKKLTNKKNSW